jgi:GxxExxY protein
VGDFRLISETIIGAAIEVHRHVGPGLFESTYEACLEHELGARGLRVERQKALSLVYKDLALPQAGRLDLLVENCVVVELKSVERLERLHQNQLMSYLRLSGCHVGLLINFNVALLKDGIRRIVHRLPRADDLKNSARSASSARSA